jgi:threonine dehydrogenase-like Zn-dependent dehydrogenase
MGRNKVEIHDVPDPKILNSHDAIIRITKSAICGSDLHLYDGCIPTMKKGDVIGHEFMGEVVETGRLEPQDRRPYRRPVPDRVRCLRQLPARPVLGL